MDRESKAGLGFKKTFIAALIAFLAGAVTFTFLGDNSGPKKFVEKNQVKIISEQNRKVVPALDVADYKSGTINFSEDQVVVLNFWASWCGPCRTETPLLVAAAASFPEVQFIGLTNDDTEDDALAFAEQFNMSYQIGNGDDYLVELSPVQAIYGLPTTLILDKQHRIAAKIIGGITDAEFRTALLKISAE